MAWLVGLISIAINAILQLWRGAPKPIAVVEAEQAGVANQALAQETNSNVEVAKAAAAVDVVIAAIDTDDKLRKYEASDPNNRDNG